MNKTTLFRQILLIVATALSLKVTVNAKNTYWVEENDSLNPVSNVNWGVSSLGGGATGEWAPYLMGSNSGGRHAMKSIAGINGHITRDFDKSKRFTWTAGIELSADYQSSARYEYYDTEKSDWTDRSWHPSSAVVNRLWAGIKFRGVMLWAGMRDHESPVVDDRLSSGDIVLSNNARAIPQIEIGFIDFQNIPFTKGWAQIAGSISYGKYTDSDALKKRFNYYNGHITLGQFFTYKRINFRSKPSQPLSVTVGVQAAGEFGGTTYYYSKGNQIIVRKNNSDLRSFWEMFIPTPRYSDGFVEGNHLGSWDFDARYRLRSGIELEGYFQWFWEDGSGMAKRNLTDGLWGVSVSFPKTFPGLKKIIAEYIDFRDQSGPIHWAPLDSPGTTIITEATGGDNYYNNSSFNAWANYGLGLGSSFVKAPLYNSNGYPQFEHNRTRGFQIAATGFIIPTLCWTAKFSHGVAWGSGRTPYAAALKNTSLLVDINWDATNLLDGLSIGATVAFDAGKLRGNNFGAMAKVSYSGNFSLNKSTK